VTYNKGGVEMATVTIRLDNQKRDELEQLAQDRNSTVSDMLRVAIDGLLGRDVPHSLDMVARRSLALAHEILAHLEPNEEAKREHRRKIRVLSKGYTSEYHREFYTIDTEFPPADGLLVMDILDMFRALEASLGELDDDALTELGDGARHLLEFVGFDYQQPREARLAEFAEHLIDDDRWTSLAHHFGDTPNEPNCPNSHAPMLARYQRMLLAYDKITTARATSSGIRGIDAYRFDVHDLKTMLAATHRPGA
jgi:uncharacterized protein YfbU (UPF0304 family)